MATGRIHSIESMGLVDGPGIRAVVFLQGCRLRCRYCHNPDTWNASGGEEISANALVERLCRFKPYFKNGGGVTFSGGEPLLQKEFLVEALKKLKENGIHTCIDTAGVGEGDYSEILKYTDLVILDIKHKTADGYRAVTGCEMKEVGRFIKALKEAKTPIWLRHVVVPTLTDGEDHLAAMKEYMLSFERVEKVEFLPYHVLGAHKYAALGMEYSLKGVPPADKTLTERLNRETNDKLKEKENEYRR